MEHSGAMPRVWAFGVQMAKMRPVETMGPLIGWLHMYNSKMFVQVSKAAKPEQHEALQLAARSSLLRAAR